MPADLHIHSTFSDGTDTPEEIASQLKEAQIMVASLTDHDSISGTERFINACKKEGIIPVPGIELSSVFEGEDVHILGYGINFRDTFLAEYLKDLRQKRVERLEKIIDCLRDNGFDVDLEELFHVSSGEYAVGRAHLARLLVEKGYVESVEEAFDKWLGRGKLCFSEKYILSPEAQIQVVLELEGIPVLAHPAAYRKKPDIDELLKVGLKGIEVFHPDHSVKDVAELLDLAFEKKLVITGGSDSHGRDQSRGFTIGTAFLPEIYVEDFLSNVIK